MAAHNPYHVRVGNAFRLLSGADAFTPAKLDAIREAKRYVLFEQYLVNSGELADQFIEAFVECAQHGVPVYMLLDDFGSRRLSEADRRRIRDAGIQLAFYNPAHLTHFLRGLSRNHNKLLLIDGEYAFTGGAGITDEFLPMMEDSKAQIDAPLNTNNPVWMDVVVEMRGPIVDDWQRMFCNNWKGLNVMGGGPIDVPPVNPWKPGEQHGRVAVSQRGRRKFLRRALMGRIGHASDKVWLCTAYWLPGRTMLRELRAAAQRGADVRLLLPGPINDHATVYHAGRRYYHYLLRHGVRIFEYQPAFMHAKLYMCDRWCSIGSCNMDRWGLRWNLEANLESDDPQLCAQAEAFFKQSIEQSHEITLQAWRQRPVINRLREWLFGYIDLMIERFGMNREMRRQNISDTSTTNNFTDSGA
ncbi:MAG: phosphatidylserine/phosphatidylglycerophosphate/cardiolipin synthase family protein [Mariprofundaceae bacterium]|nr:phosphatidylserine/phosphatidylglycerophosphate/cardiolipin synthase family protein [Mariprofundaceae bacterium]